MTIASRGASVKMEFNIKFSFPLFGERILELTATPTLNCTENIRLLFNAHKSW